MYDPFAASRALATWHKAALASARMWLAASEVIWTRSAMMALGTMSTREATRMVFEKPATFAKAAERAAMAMARNQSAATIALAGVRPIESKARGNARRLRRR